MELVYLLGGGAPIIKKYLATAAIANAGVVLEASDSLTGAGGVQAGPATGVHTAAAGLAIDALPSTVFPADPDGQVNADASVYVSVIINPNAVYRAKLAGSATEDTALATFSPDAADSLGENATDSATTAIQGGALWGISGSNAGAVRRVDDTGPRVGISFPNAIATTDVYSYIGAWPCSALLAANIFMNRTTLLTQVDGQTATTDEENFYCVDLELKDSSEDGTTNSYVHLIPTLHIFGAGMSSTLLT